jgi:hypothetical protein
MNEHMTFDGTQRGIHGDHSDGGTPVLNHTVCRERIRLLGEYGNIVRYYSECVNEFAKVAGIGCNADVGLLRRLSMQAWDAAERARVALVRHESEHFCEAVWAAQ